MDQIRIKNLEIYCHHGVLKEENVLGQKFLVSLTLYTDTRKAGTCDDIAYSINYADVSHFAEQRMKAKNYQLIEAVAEHLAEDILLEFPLVSKLEVEIKKPWAPILLPIDTVSVCIERGWKKVYLSVGANLGERENNIVAAVKMITKDAYCKNVQLSRLRQTKPYGYTDQPDFINGAVVMETLYSPFELLKMLQLIEKAGDRKHDIHWGPRTIDLDILLYEDEQIQTSKLTIPHIDMHNREFVLKPMADLAPYTVHPVFHETILQLLDKVKEKTDD